MRHSIRFTAAAALAAAAVAAFSSIAAADLPTQPPVVTSRGPARDRILHQPGQLSHWAFVARNTTARARPAADATAVTRLATHTRDGTSELVLLLREHVAGDGRKWVLVRLPVRPNGTTGWVLRSQLGGYHAVHTWLRIGRRHLHARLISHGRVVFRAPIGVGQSGVPTPPGRFYVRDELISGDPHGLYGPIALGTSATSDKLTDWPGGGYIGIYGTNQPSLIPGRPSHGCIRMRNQDIARLAHLMPVGTPITIN